MLYGNRVEKLYSKSEIQTWKLIKFIPLLPNLQTIEVSEKHIRTNQKDEFVSSEMKKHSKPLKNLTMTVISKINTLEILEIFDIEELNINNKNSIFIQLNKSLRQKYIEFISKMKNLRKYSGYCNQQLLEVLSQKNLESIEFDAKFIKEKNVQEFLKCQTSLKSLKIENLNDNILLTICENLDSMEELLISYDEI